MWDLNLDLSFGICNASCPWCFVPHYPSTYPKQFLTVKDCKRFVQLHKQYASHCIISIAGFGEPLLNPEFFEIVALLKQAFHLGALTTNFSSKLSEDQIKFLLSSFSDVIINVGGFQPSERKVYMNISKDFFLENLKILQTQFSNFSNYTFLVLNASPLNLPKPFRVQKPSVFCKNLCDQSTHGILDYSSYIKHFVGVEDFQPIECNRDNQFRILSNGDVLLCCYVPYDNEAVVGNVFETSLNKIIESLKFKKFLENKKERKYCNTFCSDCKEAKICK